MYELVRVTWNPTWEPIQLKETWDCFRKRIEEYEARQIFLPTKK